MFIISRRNSKGYRFFWNNRDKVWSAVASDKFFVSQEIVDRLYKTFPSWKSDKTIELNKSI